MKKKTLFYATILSFITIVANSTGCAVSEDIAMKSGAQIWGENCTRCHNAASPETFSDVDWEVAGMHMRLRANLTEEEALRVVEFLQSAN